MQSSTIHKTPIQPKTLREMLPGLSGILTKEAMQIISVQKTPRPTTLTRTAEKNHKPLTLAEMRPVIQVLRPVQSSRRPQQFDASAKKKVWNSLSKVVPQRSIIEGKKSSVRKKLYESKTSAIPIPKSSQNAVTPKFTKPEIKPIRTQKDKTNIRISGISNIPMTPDTSVNLYKGRITLVNKISALKQRTLVKDLISPQRALSHKTLPDTPMSNDSLKSSGDASFLLKEKAIAEEGMLENIAEVSPPDATPFKENLTPFKKYRAVDSNAAGKENSPVHNELSFDQPFNCQQNKKTEENVILSLCDLLNKVNVTNTETENKQYCDLTDIQKQTEQKIKLLDSGIEILQSIRESEIKSLQHLRNLLPNYNMPPMSDININRHERYVPKQNTPSTGKKRATPLKSPSYKIPKRNMCMRKSITSHNLSREVLSPSLSKNKALNMYMNMKQQMKFLSTPIAKQREQYLDTTPALTSHNLQRQLSKLFNEC